MNIEMTDLDMILNHLETTSLEPHDDYTSEIKYKDQKILYKYIKNLQQENKQLKEVINKIESLIKSKDNGTCIHNNERRGAYTFVLNFDEAREFVWNLEDILKEVS